MFRRLLYRILGDDIKRKLDQAYEAGVSTGYQLGYRLGQVEKSNRGFIFGSKLEEEIEEILKRKEVNNGEKVGAKGCLY